MFSHLKRRIGVLTAVAVLAALVPTLAVSTVSAAPLTVAANPTNSSTYATCPGSANIPSAGFTDTTSTDVDCIAYYGITTGVTATTYEPSASVPRWQMALYLTRMATKTGHTLGSGADQGFTDISGESAEIQTAINQLKQLGVTNGTTATTYSPDNNVTREEMAMFVERLLGLTAVGPNGAAVSSAALLTTNIGTLETQNAYNYTDIDGAGITFEGHEAIEELYNLGVPGHLKTVTTFSPAADITRADMATWLTNALGHTNLRPAGVNIQLSATSGWANTAPTASVTYRDASFAAVSGQVIDMFTWLNSAAAGNDSAFIADGTCWSNTNVAIVGNSLTRCTIDVGDPSTDASGNIASFATSITNAKTHSFWAWTAASATKFDNDTAYGTDSSTVNGTSTAQATKIKISCDANALAQPSADAAPFLDSVFVKHGTTITITMQMAATQASGVYTSIAQPDNSIVVTHSIAQPNVATLSTVTNTTVTTDANGTATYSFTQADPNVNGASVSDTADDVLHLIVVTDLATEDGTTGPQAEESNALADGSPCWQDSQADGMSFDFMDTVSGVGDATRDSITTNVSSYKAGSATAPVSRTATATLRDKFGDVVANESSAVQFYGGIADALVVLGDVSTNDILDTGAVITNKFPVGTAVCLVTANDVATTIAGISKDTVYYVQAIHAGAGGGSVATAHAVKLAATSGGAMLPLTGDSKATDKLVAAHPTMGCGTRSVGPAGTASIAWNDTGTTSTLDQIYVTTSQGESATGESGTTAMRWLAPASTALGVGVANTLTWTETNTQGAGADETADAYGTPMVVDLTNNTMVVKLNYGQGGTDRFIEDIAAAASVFEVDLLAYNGTFLSAGFSLNGPVCFGTPAGFETTAPVAGTVYYIKTIADGTANGDDTKVSVSASIAAGEAGGLFTIVGTPSGADTYIYPAVVTSQGPQCGYETYVQYTWDSADHFYLKSSGGGSTTPTTEAGFEGSYIASGGGAYGLEGHRADTSSTNLPGSSYTLGDLDDVAYQALAANISVFKLGG